MMWLRRLWLLATGRSRARDLDEEMRANLAMAIEDAGESDDAQRAARRDFGSLTRANEEARALWYPGWDTLAQDVRFAARTLRRSPGFCIVAILSLALGTGAATALFSLVNTVVLKPLAYRDPDRLVFVRETVQPLAHIYPTMPVNVQHYGFWSERARSFDGVAALRGAASTLDSEGEVELLGAADVSWNLFDVLGAAAEAGRTFVRDEGRPGRPTTVVISDSLWRRRFGASPAAVGKTIRLGGVQATVIGVMPAEFRFPRKDDLGQLTRLAERTDVFFPIQDTFPGWGGDYDYVVLGRLRPGVTIAQARGELDLLESRIVQEHALGYGLHVQVRPLQDAIASPVSTGLAVLLSAVLMLVLIVCVNLANLLLARGTARAREYSLRIALGAARGRLLVGSLIETLLLSGAGAVLGIFAARAALAIFVRTAPVNLPRMDEVRVDGAALAFAIGLAVLCGILFGLLPAWRLSHSDPQNALRGGSHTSGGSRKGLRTREWLVGAEVALSALLLVLAGLLVSSLWHVLHVDRGFTEQHAIDIHLSVPSRYRSPEARAEFLERASAAVRSLPGVREAAVASRVPLMGESNVNEVRVEGGRDSALDPVTKKTVMVNVRFIGEGYFPALGIRLLRGRMIEAADRDRSPAVISERLAAKLWPNENPLGRVISSGSGVSKAEVVGVVTDVHSTQLERDPTMMIYVPFWKFPHQATELVVRAEGDPRTVMGALRPALMSLDPALPPPRMRTMDEIVEESVAQRSFQMRVAGAFGIAGLLLAALGIYGVVAYGMTLRRRELGIRMALGARKSQLCRLMVWRGLRPVALGLAVGIAAALAAGRAIRSLLFGITATDATTFSAVAIVLACVATAACVMPSWSAARVDPASVLRDE